MNIRILIAAAAAVGSAIALPASPVAAVGGSNCDSQYVDDCTPCEYDESIVASSPDCVPPCEYDPRIPADSPSCDPCLYPQSSTIDPECEETTTTTQPPETTAPPTTAPPTTAPPTTTGPTTTAAPTTTGPTTTEPESEQQVPVTTTVAGDTGLTPEADPTTTVAAASNAPELPETGGNGTTAVIALAFLAAGAALVAASRRPQTT